MAHTIVFGGVQLVVPGAASITDATRIATAGLAGDGVVAIVGEAEGGEGYDGDKVHIVTKANAASAKNLFRSGPLADAIQVAFQPANDPDIPGGASSLLAVRVNPATQSTINLDNGTDDLIKLDSTLFGAHANLIARTVTSVTAGTGTGRTITLQFDTEDPITTSTVAIQDPSSDDDVAFKIQYTGDASTGTMVITGTSLATTLAGDQTDGSVNLSLDFTDYPNISNLVDFIDVQTGYSATLVRTDGDTFASGNLDHVGNTVAVDIKTAEVKLYSSTYDTVQEINAVQELVTATRLAASTTDEGQISAATKAFLAGGSKGATPTNTFFQASADLLKTVECEHVVPLLSADISGGADLASVNTIFDTHAADMSNAGGNKERTAHLSIDGTKTAVKAEAARLNSFHSTLSAQKLKLSDVTGTLKDFDEWGGALVAACMRAGATEEGMPLTNKFLRASGVTQDASWDPTEDGAEMLLAGLLFYESVPGSGIKCVKGVTTYTKTDNLALIDESQVFLWKRIQKRIRDFLDARYTGQKGLVATVESFKQDLVAALEQERSENETITDSILADGTVERAYTDPTVAFSNGRIDYEYGIKVVGGINFITGTQFLENVEINL